MEKIQFGKSHIEAEMKMASKGKKSEKGVQKQVL
jgi:hypothetical protein